MPNSDKKIFWCPGCVGLKCSGSLDFPVGSYSDSPRRWISKSKTALASGSSLSSSEVVSSKLDLRGALGLCCACEFCGTLCSCDSDGLSLLFEGSSPNQYATVSPARDRLSPY